MEIFPADCFPVYSTALWINFGFGSTVLFGGL